MPEIFLAALNLLSFDPCFWLIVDDGIKDDWPIFYVYYFYFILSASLCCKIVFSSLSLYNLPLSYSISLSSFFCANLREFYATYFFVLRSLRFFYVGSMLSAWYWLLIIYLTVIIFFCTFSFGLLWDISSFLCLSFLFSLNSSKVIGLYPLCWHFSLYLASI